MTEMGPSSVGLRVETGVARAAGDGAGGGSSPSLADRVLALECLSRDRWERLDHTLSRLEAAIDRMDRRMWLAVCSCAAAGASALAALIWKAAGL